MNFRWVHTENGLRELAADWQALFARDPVQSVFLSWEWVSNWWRQFGRGRALRVLCVGTDAEPLRLILPFHTIPRQVLGGSVGWDWLLLGANSVACTDHLGLIGAPDVSPAEVGTAMDEVWDRMGPTDRLRLTDLRTGDPWEGALRAWAVGRGLPLRAAPGPICPASRLPATWDEFMQGLSRNFRAQVRSSFRKVEGNPALSCRRITDPDEARARSRDLVALNVRRMGHKGVTSNFRDARLGRFLEDMAVGLTAADRAWVDVIDGPQGTVAVALHLVEGRTVSYYQGGFDPVYAGFRPATVLFVHVIQRAIAEGYQWLDFLRGDEAYKYRWGAVPVAGRTLVIARPGAVPKLLHGAADGWERVARAVASRWPAGRTAAAAMAAGKGRNAPV